MKDQNERYLEWWRQANQNPANIAMLKRAESPLEVMMIGEFHTLVKKIGAEEKDLDKLAYIAMVLSHVKENTEKPLAKIMGERTKNGEHAVSENRFKRIIASDLEDAAIGIIRVLPIVGNRANVEELAKSLWFWNSEKQYSKKSWLTKYYLNDEGE